MLYGRQLDDSLEYVDGSRYALVHAVAKRARQITRWLTADPAELQTENTPPPAAGELISRDPVALAEAEILDGAVNVRWDPEGRSDDAGPLEIDPTLDEELLVEGVADDDLDADPDAAIVTPALAQVLEGTVDADEAEDVEEAEEDGEPAVPPASEADTTVSRTRVVDGEEITEISLEEVEEPDEGDEDDDPDA